MWLARVRTGWRDAVIDVVPPVALWVAGILDMVGDPSTAVGDALGTTSFWPSTIICALLIVRRRFPLGVLCGVVAVIAVPIWFVPIALGYWGEFIPWLLAVYACARHGSSWWTRIAGAIISAATLAVIAVRFPEMDDPGDLLYDAALLAAAWTLGLFARSWSRYRDEAIRRDVAQAQAEQQAAARERARIAREMHDVISHTISVIVMQAGGARMAAAADPAIAITALSRIETLGQESLGELRSLLTVLSDETTDAVDTAPQPTLADLIG